MNNTKTGELIRVLRKEKNMTQKDIADLLHITDKAVSKWERGLSAPDIALLEPLAKALGVSIIELIEGERVIKNEYIDETETTAKVVIDYSKSEIKHKVKSMRKKYIAVTAVVIIVSILLGVFAYFGFHYFSTVAEDDLNGLSKKASDYLKYDELFIVKTAKRGNYLSALCTDNNSNWCMCVFEIDDVFGGRFDVCGGRKDTKGKLSSWNVSDSKGNVVLVFYGAELSDEIYWYSFENSGIEYICPVNDSTALDIFIIPDSINLNSYPIMLDKDKKIIE